MNTPIPRPDGKARDFWASVLASGAVGDIPRWPADSGLPVRYEEVLPAALRDGVADLARSLDVPVPAVLLAAHGAVVAALAGEREVCVGYRPEADIHTALPCRLRVDGPDWRHLVRAAAETADGVLRHRHHPIDQLRAELGVPTPHFEAVLDLAESGDDLGLPAGVVVWTTIHSTDTGLRLRLRAPGDAADEDYLSRVCGYYRTVLAALVADPAADPSRQSVLPERERRWQLDELTGPVRELPDRRMHELFEERVAAHPERVAATYAGTDWTYAELNGHANRIAHALLARGVTAEQVVAVVTERNLDWLAAVLAIFKAGGVYLPVEPHFPAGRVAAMLARSECRIALTEQASRTQLDEALGELPETTVVPLDSLVDAGLPDTDPGVPVGRDQLAYIYFTSGSTGEPKGAMCEHAGMLNHLYAKIDDLGIEDGQTVAQIAPQCFDISLWQLVSALLVGGRTLIIEQDVVLDVPRCVELVAGGDVSVMQVVPSYLEVLLAHLDQDAGGLGALHCVSATGEALKAELVERWFARFPGIKLVNAYGLTETSDDTNHEVLTAAPADGRVPLGRTVSNVWVGVVDEQLSPVPLGAPGEIVFSGVCVGRGYINDEERTKAAFLPDPHRPGERLYRSGDFGRWLPGGKLEFLGRRDAQVKLRGFRIEIGEIENRLLAVAGVRDAAVVVAQTPEGEQHLVAFYGGASELPLDLLRSELGAKLPGYMVPTDFHRLDSLPLTGNGKIDKKALRAMATELAAAGAHAPTAVEAPRTPTEQRLAAAWASVLKMPVDQIGRDQNFFDSGGTSLSAVRLAIALDRQISMNDMLSHPVLADLAAAMDERSALD